MAKTWEELRSQEYVASQKRAGQENTAEIKKRAQEGATASREKMSTQRIEAQNRRQQTSFARQDEKEAKRQQEKTEKETAQLAIHADKMQLSESQFQDKQEMQRYQIDARNEGLAESKAIEANMAREANNWSVENRDLDFRDKIRDGNIDLQYLEAETAINRADVELLSEADQERLIDRLYIETENLLIDKIVTHCLALRESIQNHQHELERIEATSTARTIEIWDLAEAEMAKMEFACELKKRFGGMATEELAEILEELDKQEDFKKMN